LSYYPPVIRLALPLRVTASIRGLMISVRSVAMIASDAVARIASTSL
jgi:hypothetical protein